MKKPFKRKSDSNPSQKRVAKILEKQVAFFEEGIVPTPMEKDAQIKDALLRCLWLLNVKGVKELLKGYDYDYVVNYAKGCFEDCPEKESPKYGCHCKVCESVRDSIKIYVG